MVARSGMARRRMLGATAQTIAKGYFPASGDFLPSHPRRFGLGSSAGVGADSFGSASGSFTLITFSFFGLVGFSSADFSSAVGAASTHSINAIDAESLLRWPSFTMRV